MRATVLADASYCPRTGAAGYGYWIASDRGKRGGGAELRRATSSGVAEMMAVVNALWMARETGLVQGGDYVLVQTDCQAAIGAFEGTRCCHDVDEQAVLGSYHELVRKSGMRVYFRHVKGHTSRHRNPEARFGANRACDGRAGEHMRRARARIDEEARREHQGDR